MRRCLPKRWLTNCRRPHSPRKVSFFASNSFRRRSVDGFGITELIFMPSWSARRAVTIDQLSEPPYCFRDRLILADFNSHAHEQAS